MSEIAGEPKEYYHIISKSRLSVEYVQIDANDIAAISRDVLAWAASQSISEGLRCYRDLPTDSAGILPLFHLAAMAMNGEKAILGEYLQSFKDGDRMGFVPYIKEETIGRALDVAKRYASPRE